VKHDSFANRARISNAHCNEIDACCNALAALIETVPTQDVFARDERS